MLAASHHHVTHGRDPSRLGLGIGGNHVDVVDHLLIPCVQDHMGIAVADAFHSEGALVAVIALRCDHRVGGGGDARVDILELGIAVVEEVGEQVEALAQQELGRGSSAHADGDHVLAGGLALLAHDDGRITQGVVLVESDAGSTIVGIVAGTQDLADSVAHDAVMAACVDVVDDGAGVAEVGGILSTHTDHGAGVAVAQTQLALLVAAPGIDLALQVQRQGVVITGGHSNDTVVRDSVLQPGGSAGAHVGGHSQLTVGVGAPAVHITVEGQGQAVVLAGRDGHGGLVVVGTDVAGIAAQPNRGRRGGDPGRTDSQAVEAVIAGGVDQAVPGQEQAVLVSSRDGGHRTEAHQGGHGHVVGVAQAQLAGVVTAPDIHGAVLSQGQGELLAGRDRREADLLPVLVQHIRHLHKAVDRAGDSRDTQLAVRVAAGDPKVALGIHSQAVILAGRGVHELHSLDLTGGIGVVNGAARRQDIGLDHDRIVGALNAHDGAVGVVVIPQAGTVVVHADAQLAGGVDTVGPDGVIGTQGQSVLAARDRLGHD